LIGTAHVRAHWNTRAVLSRVIIHDHALVAATSRRFNLFNETLGSLLTRLCFFRLCFFRFFFFFFFFFSSFSAFLSILFQLVRTTLLHQQVHCPRAVSDARDLSFVGVTTCARYRTPCHPALFGPRCAVRSMPCIPFPSARRAQGCRAPCAPALTPALQMVDLRVRSPPFPRA
jgi:hypothetical protein